MLSEDQLDLQYVVNEAGCKTAVIVPIEQFEGLLTDISDLASVAERREESSITHDDLLSQLKRDGLL